MSSPVVYLVALAGLMSIVPGTLLLPEFGGNVLLHDRHLIQRSNSLCLILHLIVFFEVFDVFRMDQILFLRILVMVSMPVSLFLR